MEAYLSCLHISHLLCSTVDFLPDAAVYHKGMSVGTQLSASFSGFLHTLLQHGGKQKHGWFLCVLSRMPSLSWKRIKVQHEYDLAPKATMYLSDVKMANQTAIHNVVYLKLLQWLKSCCFLAHMEGKSRNIHSHWASLVPTWESS